MEDAAKRRQRLMALRSEAAQTSGAPPPAPLPAAELPDPLFSSSSLPAEAAPATTHRFDYYTNPSAAFSSAYNLNKRKTSSSSSPSPSPSPSPASRPHARPNVGLHNYAGPNQPPPYDAPPAAHWRNPALFQPQPPWNMPPPSAGPGAWRPTNDPPSGMPYMHRPRGAFPNPSFVRDGSSSGPRPLPNPNPNPNWNMYSNPRGPAGRGRGFQNRFGQGNYYSRSMVEDPWMELEPVVGKLLESLDVSGSCSGSRSWLPESLRKKESSKPGNVGNRYDKKLSLAEYLDLSINQAVDEM